MNQAFYLGMAEYMEKVAQGAPGAAGGGGVSAGVPQRTPVPKNTPAPQKSWFQTMTSYLGGNPNTEPGGKIDMSQYVDQMIPQERRPDFMRTLQNRGMP